MLEKLTPEQEAKMASYRDEAIRVGMLTSREFNEKLVHELTDKHRVSRGLEKATNFLVYDSPFAAIKAIPSLTPSNAIYGNQDSYWLYTYDFFRKECKIEGLDIIQHLYDLCSLMGWAWMSSDTTVVTKLPVDIRTLRKPAENVRGYLDVLHNYVGLALEYADGTGVYSINGTRIPAEYKHMMEALPREVSASEVLGIANTEIRTELLKKIGIERAFDSLKKKSLDKKTIEVGGTYELFSVTFPNDSVRIYLQGECPSNKEKFYEAAHPDCKTVEQALSFRNFGDLSISWVTPVELT
jgi:hypothetical protein